MEPDITQPKAAEPDPAPTASLERYLNEYDQYQDYLVTRHRFPDQTMTPNTSGSTDDDAEATMQNPEK